ncbi:RdgB/HAM1 family non-canonical purine NTP pyrophosphatase [Aestuariirhabdus sp. Z084]|uniref:RdgB/HAM1 family non-canonical purine NTP pyrophosphatase n=1 Tax=Aestuariirhabdus haliotis TaxID=2918751 RepID=UPI00201B3CCC|nr:RdgB/HAM1 family non-canonical purine NTP pyrophosphatase [Aestuariirhabdus haliotis]MCL6414152.1 RdgB/HAM1 family non-canonical purine NTP pyrophosphatase [Aestuariirhabdus haliotis]MCL6418084.1 RdgB/HAM1 family non-canonical purine NTP pyrophosphatase [Aestuariirhabdus haliotis]
MSTEIQQVVLASNNRGKLNELQHRLGGLGIKLLPQSQFAIDSVAETGLSFVENAIIKARHACKISGLPAIADDSGLEVDALLGAPGIYSARFAGEEATDADNNQKLLAKLQGTPSEQRSARFRCLLVYMRHADDPTPLICQGSWEGFILEEPRGDNGFGYDPLFFVPSEHCASAELPADLKNRLSHRGQAMKELMQRLKLK